MKKLLFSTLALAAVVVASPVLATEFSQPDANGNMPALKDSPKKPEPGSEFSVPEKAPEGAQPMNPEVVNNPETATPAEGEPHIVFENGKYWAVVKFPGGENRIELTGDNLGSMDVNGMKYPDAKLTPEIIAGLMSGVPGSEEGKKSEEKKSEEKAVKDAMNAAKKDAAKKDAKKALPNTAAVK